MESGFLHWINVALKTLRPRVSTQPARLSVIVPGSWRTADRSSTQRGYGYAWQKARAAYLVKHPYCVYCLRDAGIVATTIEGVILECAERGFALPVGNTVDHSVPHRGDMKLFWDSSKWQTMCPTHHSRDKQREEATA